MGFAICSRNITEEKRDLIVNSLGMEIDVPGRLFRSILNECDGDELLKEVKSKKGSVSIGDMFLTDSYGLSSKHILHLVMPYAAQDPNMTAFETIIRDMLVFCSSHGYKKISVPILGTGYNGYNQIEAENILMSMCSSFVNIYPEMDIRVIKKPIDFKIDYSLKENNRKDYEEFSQIMADYFNNKNIDVTRAEREYDLDFFQKSGPIQPLSWVKKAPSVAHKTVEVDLGDKDANVEEYIKQYLKIRYNGNHETISKELNNVKLYIGKNNKRQGGKNLYKISYVENKTTPNRTKMFQVALALKMNMYEAERFLEYFGISFYMNSKLEKTIALCIKWNIYNMNAVDNELRKAKVGTLFL